MKLLKFNEHNLENYQMDYEIIRVKCFIINDNNQCLVAFNNNTFQLIGGHVSLTENKEEALKREIKEETGIEVDSIEEPFVEIVSYNKNHLKSEKNVISKIFYYVIKTNSPPDFSKTNYDELERQSDFNLFYVNMNNFKNFLDNSLKDNKIEKDIYNELIYVLKEF